MSAAAAEPRPDPAPDVPEPAPQPTHAAVPDPAPGSVLESAPDADPHAAAGSVPEADREQVPAAVPAPGSRPGPEPVLDGPPVPPGAILKLALGFYGVVALFALGYALFSGGLSGLSGLFGERAPEIPGLLAGLGIGVALVLLSRVGARGWPPMRRMRETLADLLGPLGWQPALLLALLSGTAEELLFRGALWHHLGLVGTTLLFGLVHVLPRRALWVYPLFATLAGLLFGLVREGTQSLWPCILAHVVVNALNLVWIGQIAKKRTADPA